MKKIFVLLLMSVLTLGANAQFEKGTHYAGAYLSGLGVGYDKGNFRFGLGGEYGYYINCGQERRAEKADEYAGVHALKIKPNFRYSFMSNGINLGCGLQFEHAGTDRNFIQLCPQVGYTFYLNDKISLEPALYADFALNDFKNGTSAGLKIGIGLYK